MLDCKVSNIKLKEKEMKGDHHKIVATVDHTYTIGFFWRKKKKVKTYEIFSFDGLTFRYGSTGKEVGEEVYRLIALHDYRAEPKKRIGNKP